MELPSFLPLCQRPDRSPKWKNGKTWDSGGAAAAKDTMPSSQNRVSETAVCFRLSIQGCLGGTEEAMRDPMLLLRGLEKLIRARTRSHRAGSLRVAHENPSAPPLWQSRMGTPLSSSSSRASAVNRSEGTLRVQLSNIPGQGSRSCLNVRRALALAPG